MNEEDLVICCTSCCFVCPHFAFFKLKKKCNARDDPGSVQSLLLLEQPAGIRPRLKTWERPKAGALVVGKCKCFSPNQQLVLMLEQVRVALFAGAASFLLPLLFSCLYACWIFSALFVCLLVCPLEPCRSFCIIPINPLCTLPLLG